MIKHKLRKRIKISLSLMLTGLLVMLLSFSAIGAFAQTKDDIYSEYEELEPFTDPELFMERYALRKDDRFDPDAYDYFFYNYKTKMTVGSDNVLNITEMIDVYFRTPHHGIYRNLPLFNSVARTNGITTLNTCRISGIYCDRPSTVEYRNDDVYIKIGDESTMLTGFQQYRLQYTYDLGKDPLKDSDEFYFNLIGQDFSCPTLRAEFEIEMPKRFDASSLHFYTGYSGSEDTSMVEYEVDGTTIKGGTTAFLNSGEALTCYMKLPEGYFADAHTIYDYGALITLGIITLMMLILTLIYFYSRARNKYTLYLQFTPPMELNPLEAAFVKFGRVDNRKVVSLLPYLASKGYLTIEELSKGGNRNSKNIGFVYTAEKPYNGRKQDESIFYRGLFGNKSGRSRSKDGKEGEGEKRQVFDHELKDKFFKTVDMILSYIRDGSGTYGTFFVSGGTKVRTIFAVILVAMGSAAAALPLSFSGPHILVNFSIPEFIMLTIFLAMLNAALVLVGKLGKIFIGLFIGAAIYLEIFFDNTVLLASDIAVITTWVVIFIFSFVYGSIQNIRTEYGRELFGRIKGFENFIRHSDAKDIDALCKTNSRYYYDVMPYAYALGFNDKWDKYFDYLSHKEPPDWYDCNYFSTGFSMSSMRYMMNASSREMISSPSDPSGSGFSGGGGGGSAGGGSGGGGAGAW